MSEPPHHGTARGGLKERKHTRLTEMLVELSTIYFFLAVFFFAAEGGFFEGCADTCKLHENLYPLSLLLRPGGRELFSLLGLLLLLPLCLKVRPFIKEAFSDDVEPSMLSYALFYVVYLAFTWFDGIGTRYLSAFFYLLFFTSFSVILDSKNPGRAGRNLYASYFRSIGDLLGPRWSKNAVSRSIRFRDLYIPLALLLFALSAYLSKGPTTSDLVVLAAILSYFTASSIEVRRKRVPAPFP